MPRSPSLISTYAILYHDKNEGRLCGTAINALSLPHNARTPPAPSPEVASPQNEVASPQKEVVAGEGVHMPDDTCLMTEHDERSYRGGGRIARTYQAAPLLPSQTTLPP